jgi:hypothetical protein
MFPIIGEEPDEIESDIPTQEYWDNIQDVYNTEKSH